MALTETKIRAAKPTEKAYRLWDGAGLYLEVDPSGGKWWRFKYRVDDKEKRISLGVYPAVSLAKARQKRDENRAMVADGDDPSLERQNRKATRIVTFELVAREWLGLYEKKLAPITLAKGRCLRTRSIRRFGGLGIHGMR